MTDTSIAVRTFLGDFYTDLHGNIVESRKYRNAGIGTFFDQEFQIQSNKVLMVVDPLMQGYSLEVIGNQVNISQKLYSHAGVKISNSIEDKTQESNPQSLYSASTFSTMAYLVCQNHTMLRFSQDLDEPVYVKFTSDTQSFYNSVLLFMLQDGVKLNVIEEIESLSAVNGVTNYVVGKSSRLNVETFYQNKPFASSFYYRNVIVQDLAHYRSRIFAAGSATAVDETRVSFEGNANVGLFGNTFVDQGRFHSIAHVVGNGTNNLVEMNYKNVVSGKGMVNFIPIATLTGSCQATFLSKSLLIGDNSQVHVDHNFVHENKHVDIGKFVEEYKLTLDPTVDNVGIADTYKAMNESFYDQVMNRSMIESFLGVDRYHSTRNRFIASKSVFHK